jgi:hypothetical protein
VGSESQTRGERDTDDPRVLFLAESDEIADVIAPSSRRLEKRTRFIIVERGRKAADVIFFDGFNEPVTVLVDAVLNDAV